MKIVFISNYINHYMTPLVDELNMIDGCKTWFVETDCLPEKLRRGGFKDYDADETYVKAWKDDPSKKIMEQLALEADVLIIGNKPKLLEWKRLRQGKLTFEMSERPLKKGLINAISPVISKTQLFYHLFFYNKPVYMLCLSSFTATDEYRLHAFKDRCYQFGYFPRIADANIEEVLASKPKGKIRMIWCARFIKWKHPELAVELADRLAKAGYDFEINMVGSGVLFDDIKSMIESRNLSDYVHLLGNYPNDEVLKMMREHHIFLFTSDKNEGWGVVLNEAMGQLCCPVAANEIGAVPSLLSHNVNGKVFKSKSLDSLYQNVVEVLDNPESIGMMAKEAYKTVKEVWCPEMAAQRLYILCKNAIENKGTHFKEGPCIKALPIINN